MFKQEIIRYLHISVIKSGTGFKIYGSVFFSGFIANSDLNIYIITPSFIGPFLAVKPMVFKKNGLNTSALFEKSNRKGLWDPLIGYISQLCQICLFWKLESLYDYDDILNILYQYLLIFQIHIHFCRSYLIFNLSQAQRTVNWGLTMGRRTVSNILMSAS